RLGAGQVGADELDGDLAVEVRVVGRDDDAHAAGADPPEDDEAADAAPGRRSVRGQRAGRRRVGAAHEPHHDRAAVQARLGVRQRALALDAGELTLDERLDGIGPGAAHGPAPSIRYTRPVTLEEVYQRHLDEGRRAWPGLELAPEDFAKHL